MKCAVIARPPVTGGKLVSFDAAEAMKVSRRRKGHGGQGLAVALEIPAARRRGRDRAQHGCGDQGRDALKVVWDDGANGKYESVAYRAELEEASRKPGLVVRKDGDADAALKSADKVIVGEYYLPHLAHVSMEATGRGRRRQGRQGRGLGARCKVRAGRARISARRSIPEDNVTVNVTLLGGGFGRKSKCDYVLEAALLSKELGAPVKVQWTRRTTSATTSCTPSRWSGSRPARQVRQGDRLAASQRRSDHRLDLRAERGA